MFAFKKNKKNDNNVQYNIDYKNLPKHIAIIMDGNGRWATKKGLPRVAGHRAGVEALREAIEISSKLGVEILTLYAFSTENWKRPKKEVDALMNLLVEYLDKEIAALHKNNVKINTIGNIEGLPVKSRNAILSALELTKSNKGLIVNIALNYGGREEIIHAIKGIILDTQNGLIGLNDIDENRIKSYLYTSNLPDPDLLIRPSGELRLSNFLLWQLAYTEFWFTNILWPDFKKEHLLEAIKSYQKRDRRYGGVSNK